MNIPVSSLQLWIRAVKSNLCPMRSFIALRQASSNHAFLRSKSLQDKPYHVEVEGIGLLTRPMKESKTMKNFSLKLLACCSATAVLSSVSKKIFSS